MRFFYLLSVSSNVLSLLVLVPHRINDSNDPFERMLAVVRFTFTKDLKFIVCTNHLAADPDN